MGEEKKKKYHTNNKYMDFITSFLLDLIKVYSSRQNIKVVSILLYVEEIFKWIIRILDVCLSSVGGIEGLLMF